MKRELSTYDVVNAPMNKKIRVVSLPSAALAPMGDSNVEIFGEETIMGVVLN